MVSGPLADSGRLEEERVPTVYAKRNSGSLYSWFDPGHLFTVQDRERKVLRLLKEFAKPMKGKYLSHIRSPFLPKLPEPTGYDT